MDRERLLAPIEQLNYLLGRISHYRNKNQYVYVRPFESWYRSYNQIAEQWMEEDLISLPLFTLLERDYSPSGNSIRPDTVEKLIKTIKQQVSRLEERLAEQDRIALEKFSAPHPLGRFFTQAGDWKPNPAEEIVTVVFPAESGEGLLAQGVQPVLDALKVGHVCLTPEAPEAEEVANLSHDLFRSRLLIVNLSGQNPAAMLALGLAYGFGKRVALLWQQGHPIPDLPGDLKLEYLDAADLGSKLTATLPALLQGE